MQTFHLRTPLGVFAVRAATPEQANEQLLLWLDDSELDPEFLCVLCGRELGCWSEVGRDPEADICLCIPCLAGGAQAA